MELVSADDTAAKVADVLSYFRRRNACYPRATHRTSRRSYFLLPNTEGAEIHKV
jgi:hypothetical protein